MSDEYEWRCPACGMTVAEWDAVHSPGVAIAKNERGAWCVYIDGEVVSSHRTRDGAAISANNHIAARRTHPDEGGHDVTNTDRDAQRGVVSE